jgi:hypothetical protein
MLRRRCDDLGLVVGGAAADIDAEPFVVMAYHLLMWEHDGTQDRGNRS